MAAFLFSSLRLLGDLLLFRAFDYGDVAHDFVLHDNRGEEKLVCTVAEFRLLAVDHRIRKSIDMAGCLPDGGVHDDGRVQPDYVVAAVHHVAPPGGFDIIAELDAKRTVVVEPIVSAVDFGGRKNESAAFAEADDFFHESVADVLEFS